MTFVAILTTMSAGAADAQMQDRYFARRKLVAVSTASQTAPPKTFCSAFTPKKWQGPGSTCGQIPWDGDMSTRAARCEAEAKKIGSTQGLCASYTTSTLIYCRGGVLGDVGSTDFEGATCTTQ